MQTFNYLFTKNKNVFSITKKMNLTNFSKTFLNLFSKISKSQNSQNLKKSLSHSRGAGTLQRFFRGGNSETI